MAKAKKMPQDQGQMRVSGGMHIYDGVPMDDREARELGAATRYVLDCIRIFGQKPKKKQIKSAAKAIVAAMRQIRQERKWE